MGIGVGEESELMGGCLEEEWSQTQWKGSGATTTAHRFAQFINFFDNFGEKYHFSNSTYFVQNIDQIHQFWLI